MDLGLENTQQYDQYEDETQNKQIFPQLTEELEPMQEVGDHYIGAEILLPRKDEMTRGHVVVWSYNASRNVMGRAHIIPISIPECIRRQGYRNNCQCHC